MSREVARVVDARMLRRAVGALRLEGRLVEHVVRVVHDVTFRASLETARTIGELLLETFYGGDLDVYAAVGKEHVSMQAVVRHDDWRRPPVVAWNALDYLDQLRELPRDVAGRLSYTHHKALFRVRDARAKVRLARAAVREGLRARDLQRRVAATLGPDPAGRGRPRVPPVIALARAVEKALKAAGEVSERDVAGLSPGRRADTARSLARSARELERLAAFVREQL